MAYRQGPMSNRVVELESKVYELERQVAELRDAVGRLEVNVTARPRPPREPAAEPAARRATRPPDSIRGLVEREQALAGTPRRRSVK